MSKPPKDGLLPPKEVATLQRRLPWDDLHTVLLIGRNRSLAGAAREVRVNHSTMFRRIGAIEQRLGVRLFDRLREGYVPTAAGEEVILLAERIDADIVELERKLAGGDLRPAGPLRLTTTDTLLPLLMPICASFEEQFPEVRIELVTGTQQLSLSRRDADIAIRPAASPDENLYGRRIARIAFGVYGSRDYLNGTSARRALADHKWIGLGDSLSHLRAYRWLAANVPAARVRLIVNSLGAALQAAEAGIGLGLIPCYMASACKALVRLPEPVADASSELWILVHEDLRTVARIKTFTDFAYSRLAEARDLFDPPGAV